MTKTVNRSIISLGLLLCTFASLAQNTKYYDYAGKFKIQFPGKPTASSQVQATEIGEVTIYQFMYETETAVFMGSYVDYPVESMNIQDEKDMLERAKNGFIGELKLKITEELFIKYGKYQGILFRANNESMYCSMRDYLVGNRLYQFGILQMATDISAQAENDFFDSFELVK